MNQVWLNGRLAADPDGGESGQGVTYATFTIALEKGTGDNKTTVYIDCCTFRQAANFVRQYFKKGDAINAVGSLNVRDWTDQSGVKHRKFEVIVSQVGFPTAGKVRNGGTRRADNSPRNGQIPAGVASGPEPQPWDNPY